ncbi:hypothetical protein BS47DRAFT_1399052 [Hydnum rufescens UP504]|uniref:Uncharacterized protein n=1 Tax=Hydnum rufescens UP504 TaxID=1448309 RepID=A0A9P6AKC2_9AGAM|nr:hypothetical protein BS47DRAFT_1399052 [Hydnum rufescens UP504]
MSKSQGHPIWQQRFSLHAKDAMQTWKDNHDKVALASAGIDPTHLLSFAHTKSRESVVAIPGEALDVAAKVALHSTLNNEEMHTLCKVSRGELERAHNSVSSSSQHTGILMKIFSDLMFAMFKRAGTVSVSQQHTEESARLLKSNLLETCNKITFVR